MINYLAVNDYTQKVFYSRLYQKALTTADRLLIVNRIDSALLKEIDQSQYDMLTDESISIYDSTYKEIYTNNDSVNFKTSATLFKKIKEQKYLRYTDGQYKILGIYYANSSNNAVITAGAIDDEGASLLRYYRTLLFISFLVSMVITIVMGWYFVSNALQPISDINRKIATLSPVERSERLTLIAGKDEIARLIENFNTLFDKLETSFKLQKSFVSNASHELFNPLTKMKAQLEVSLIQERDSVSYRHTIHSVLEDMNELIETVQNLLEFSKIQSNYLIANHPLMLDELLFDIRNHLLSQHPEYRIDINFIRPPKTDEHFVVYGNRQLLFKAIKNIVENACKYSPDKTAQLDLQINESVVFLAIIDKGPGIPENELVHIFEPFYRSSDPSVEKVKGFGIGLALTNAILKAHYFLLMAESVQGKGTTFTIRFSN